MKNDAIFKLFTFFIQFLSISVKQIQNVPTMSSVNYSVVLPSEQSIVQLPTSQTYVKPIAGLKRSKAKQEKRIPLSVRLDRYDHWPRKDSKADGRRGHRCKLESCGKQSNVYCSKCNVHLCFVEGRNCFEAYHVLKVDEPTKTFE